MEIDEQRVAVWEALSELFLDTVLTASAIDSTARRLAESSYSISEIRNILYYEVYPICKWNLLSVAGEWAFFDREWLIEKISPKLNKRPLLRFPPVFKFMFRFEWLQIEKQIKQYRNE